MTEEQIKNISILQGRIDALLAFCAVIARALPPDLASNAYTQISAAIPKMDADLLAAPIPDHQIHETQRVLCQLQGVLQHAQNQQ